jgi:hypothetical protein
MKRLNLKKLVLSAAIVSAGSFAFSAVAENTSSITNDAQSSQSINVPADRNITNPNTPEYRDSVSNSESTSTSSEGLSSESRTIETNSVSGSETNSVSGEATTMAASEVDGTVHFEPNSVTLTESAERQLKQVVDQLDKNTPVALTVELQGSYSEGSDISSSQSSSATLGQDSSAGLPRDERGLTDAGVSPAERSGMPGNAPVPSNNAEAIEREQEDRALLISRYRAENVRQYLERQGIEVVEWNMEGGVSSAAGGTSSDTGFATSNPSAQQSAEEVQQVRIVVIGDVQPEGLSAL